MNKLIYAIGIAVAATFAANNKTEAEKTGSNKNTTIENIEEIPNIIESDSLKVELE